MVELDGAAAARDLQLAVEPHHLLARRLAPRYAVVATLVVGVAFAAGPTIACLQAGNVNTGAFEVYDIANNQITGAAFMGTVGLDWQFAGVAPILVHLASTGETLPATTRLPTMSAARAAL